MYMYTYVRHNTYIYIYIERERDVLSTHTSRLCWPMTRGVIQGAQGARRCSKQRQTRQWHGGERGLRTKPGFLEPC